MTIVLAAMFEALGALFDGLRQPALAVLEFNGSGYSCSPVSALLNGEDSATC